MQSFSFFLKYSETGREGGKVVGGWGEQLGGAARAPFFFVPVIKAAPLGIVSLLPSLFSSDYLIISMY